MHVASLRNDRVLSQIDEDESIRAEEPPKKNLPNGIIEGDSNVVPKTKVLPRNAEPGSSTNRDDGVRAEGLLKETVSKNKERIKN